jgi:uncharacterized SAM-binding protein YcdF (DUF218 family)
MVLLPPGGPLLLGLLGIGLLRRRPRWGQRLLVIGALLGYLCGIPFTASLLNAPLQRDPPLTESDLIEPGSSARRPGIIVVLGGGLHTDAPEYGAEPTVHDRTLGRLRYAARLARLTGLPVLATGGRPQRDDPSEAELMKAVLEQEFGIGPVLAETESRNTWENAVNSAAILRQRGIDRLLLVSNAAHLPRATAAFRAQGLTVLPAPTLFFDDQPEPLDLQSWLPSVTAVAQVHYACYEWLGRLWYAAASLMGNPAAAGR